MIERVVGDVDDATRTYRTNVWPPTPYLSLPHEIESVTSVTMGDDLVDTDDYEIEDTGATLRRKGGRYGDYAYHDGYYNSWAGDIVVVYERVMDAAVWKLALIDLVRLSSRRMGVASERTGPYAATAADSEMERETILDRIRIAEPGGVLAV